MPGIEKKPEIAGAICGPVESREVPQPRQPNDLQGLLRFAMEATKSEDAPNESAFREMDEERKQFLLNALKSMTVDVVELLQKQIDTLKNVDKIKEDDNIEKYENALATILEHVDHIDIANDFHKIGGFTVIYPCLKCCKPKIRAGACELLATLCQNNPYCQKVVLENEFIPKLINMLEKDDDKDVNVKALYAISGIVRASSEGFNQLIHYKGIPAILDGLKRNDDRFITKAAFLLDTLCRNVPDLKSRLIFLGCIDTIAQLLTMERRNSHEHLLNLLHSLVQDNPNAVLECKNAKYNLREVLTSHLEKVEGKEEFQEEEECCRRLLAQIFRV